MTDARRHPTSWPSSACGSRSRSAIPAGVTCPQRSARCQNSTSRRVSTGDSWSSASWIDMRCVRRTARSSRVLITCGQRASERPNASSRIASLHRHEHVPARPGRGRGPPRAARARAGPRRPRRAARSRSCPPASCRARAAPRGPGSRAGRASRRRAARPSGPAGSSSTGATSCLARARDLVGRDPEPKLRVQLENSCTSVAAGHGCLPSGAHGTLRRGGLEINVGFQLPLCCREISGE